MRFLGRSIRTTIILVLALLLLGGCAEEKYAEKVVATVNGVTITEEDIEELLKERSLTTDITEVMMKIAGEITLPREAMVLAFGINEEAMTSAQKRFLDNIERSSTKELDKNEALNILLVEEVLYQEAVKQGHDVSLEEAKEVLEESKRITKETVSQSEEDLRIFNEYYEKTASVYHQYGFVNEDDYLNKHLDKTAKAMAINKMNYEFNKVMQDKLPNIDPLQIEQTNAWEDYGEYLLSKAKVKILKPEYTILKYGEPWKHGKLDLKATTE